MTSRVLTAIVAVLALAIAAHAATHVITVSNFTFTPDSLNVRSGDIVRWEVASGNHTTTSGTGAADPQSGVLWNSGLMSTGQNYQRVFKGAGVFPFYCIPHELMGMKGKIVVTSSVPSSSTAAKAGLVGFVMLAGGLALWRQRRFTEK